jgi:hypothetical protein
MDMYCDHNKRIGDNYGVTCQDCGEILEGYGYGDWLGSKVYGKKCIHVWRKISASEEECNYCQARREREHKAN